MLICDIIYYDDIRPISVTLEYVAALYLFIRTMRYREFVTKFCENSTLIIHKRKTNSILEADLFDI